jgi:NAD(P)-dependent dehydrogenase (short-subunit alcohol dehydrogenase family)
MDGPADRGSLRQTVAEIETAGGSALAVACDVTQSAEVESLVRTAEGQFGRIDLLLNNAGYYPRGTIAAMGPDDWDAAISINLTGSFLLCRYVLPGMIERRGGVILNISSGSAQRYDRRHIAYSVAKAGLDRFTMNLAEEVKEHGIVVNAMGPGLVKTEMNGFYEAGDPPETVIPAVLWLLGREHGDDFTGRVVSRLDFQTTWP